MGAAARDWPRRLRPLLLVAAALLATGAWAWATQRATSAVRELPAPERSALVRRSLDNLHEICGVGGRPREFCREQATLLLSLSECDAACQAEARRELASDSAVK